MESLQNRKKQTEIEAVIFLHNPVHSGTSLIAGAIWVGAKGPVTGAAALGFAGSWICTDTVCPPGSGGSPARQIHPGRTAEPSEGKEQQKQR